MHQHQHQHIGTSSFQPLMAAAYNDADLMPNYSALAQAIGILPCLSSTSALPPSNTSASTLQHSKQDVSFENWAVSLPPTLTSPPLNPVFYPEFADFQPFQDFAPFVEENLLSMQFLSTGNMNPQDSFLSSSLGGAGQDDQQQLVLCPISPLSLSSDSAVDVTRALDFNHNSASCAHDSLRPPQLHMFGNNEEHTARSRTQSDTTCLVSAFQQSSVCEDDREYECVQCSKMFKRVCLFFLVSLLSKSDRLSNPGLM